jgi:hypothetical protein
VEVVEKPKSDKKQKPKKSENEGVVENEEESERSEGEKKESGANNTIEGEVEKGEPLIDKDSIFRKSNKQLLIDSEKGEQISHPYDKLPYSISKKRKIKDEGRFKKFREILTNIDVSIPLVDLLEQMPSYAKFMKEVVTGKRKLRDDENIALTEECNAIIQRKPPPKLKDPGSFTVPCSIRNQAVGRALCDLGASINLMPLSMMKRLGYGEVKPTRMTLTLADRSVTYPYGVLEDVPVKVNDLLFPVDFVIMDIKEDSEVPLLLGRPFLATGRALIDLELGEIKLRVNDEEVSFNVFEAMRHKKEDLQSYKVDFIDEILEEESKLESPSMAIDQVIDNSIEKEEIRQDMEIMEIVHQPEICEIARWPRQYESLTLEPSVPAVDGVSSPNVLELKELPTHLKYVFLGDMKTQPPSLVILSHNRRKRSY